MAVDVVARGMAAQALSSGGGGADKYKIVDYTVTYADGSTGVIYNVEATGGAQSQSVDQTATEPVVMESDPEHENEVV